MKKQTTPPLYLQLYVYERKSLLDKFSRCLETQFGSDWSWTVAVLSPSGHKQSKRRHSIGEALSSLADLAPEGVNRSEFLGTCQEGSSASRIVFEPSPLSVHWARIGEVPAGLPRKSHNLLLSLRSGEKYVHGNQIKRDPVFLSIELTPATPDNSGSSLFAQFEPFAKCIGSQLDKNYVGFIDASPVLPANMIVGGRPEDSTRLDKRFDKPHAVVFGPVAVIEDYWKAVAKIRPKIEVKKKKVGSAQVVLFNEPSQLQELDLPEWHAVSP